MDGISMSAASPEEMQAVERSKTIIEPFAFVGTNAIIMPGIKIGESAVIAAGAVVTRDVPSCEVWAGVPARKIDIRKKR